uniref:Ig-like domain-containing protein n=1 Tax=Poecilia formosa TaxID=48698 RepID=A0A096LQL4_POEFO
LYVVLICLIVHQIKVMVKNFCFSMTDCGLTVTPAEVYVKYGDSASINCSTTIKDAAIMSWEFAVGETSGASPPHVTWMIEKLEDFTVEPFCFVTLDTNEQCKMKPNITLYKLPDSVVVSAVGNRPMKEGEEHQLQCHIYNVAPAKKLSVKWYKDDETVLTDDLQSSDVTPLPKCLNDSTVRLCNVSSIYTFTVKKSDNGSPFRCEAEFQFGPAGPLVPPSMASEPYTAVVHYAPRFSYGNVSLVWEADGNPKPEIQCNDSLAENVRASTVGRQRIITVTRATSTNAGRYICVATNKVGKVTRATTL